MTGTLVAESIILGYQGRPAVLAGASVTLAPHRRVALLGANGSGKTTLLRTLAGAQTPKAGQVRLDGIPLGHGRDQLREHRRRVQMVLQDPNDQLFSADVAQDVSFGPMNLGLGVTEVRQRVAEALGLLGIAQLAERATHQLSYGERKRVAIAGAVAMRPDFLLLDEPTAGLDPSGVEQMLETLGRLQGQVTTLLATHDVELALAWADDVVVMSDRIASQGEALTILGDTELLAKAGLRQPWPLALAGRLGLAAAPRTLDDVARLLSQSSV